MGLNVSWPRSELHSKEDSRASGGQGQTRTEEGEKAAGLRRRGSGATRQASALRVMHARPLAPALSWRGWNEWVWYRSTSCSHHRFFGLRNASRVCSFASDARSRAWPTRDSACRQQPRSGQNAGVPFSDVCVYLCTMLCAAVFKMQAGSGWGPTTAWVAILVLACAGRADGTALGQANFGSGCIRARAVPAGCGRSGRRLGNVGESGGPALALLRLRGGGLLDCFGCFRCIGSEDSRTAAPDSEGGKAARKRKIGRVERGPVIINAPIQKVYTVITDFDHYCPDWAGDGIKKMKYVQRTPKFCEINYVTGECLVRPHAACIHTGITAKRTSKCKTKHTHMHRRCVRNFFSFLSLLGNDAA